MKPLNFLLFNREYPLSFKHEIFSPWGFSMNNKYTKPRPKNWVVNREKEIRDTLINSDD